MAGPSFPLPIEIDVATLDAWRRDSVPHAVLDVREPWEVAIASLAGSLTIPMAEVPERTTALPRDVPVVVLCHHGGRSLRVTLWLRARGFANAVNLAGGIDAWAAEVDPSMPTY